MSNSAARWLSAAIVLAAAIIVLGPAFVRPPSSVKEQQSGPIQPAPVGRYVFKFEGADETVGVFRADSATGRIELILHRVRDDHHYDILIADAATETTVQSGSGKKAEFDPTKPFTVISVPKQTDGDSDNQPNPFDQFDDWKRDPVVPTSPSEKE
jgi:hypothetical protein